MMAIQQFRWQKQALARGGHSGPLASVQQDRSVDLRQKQDDRETFLLKMFSGSSKLMEDIRVIA